MKRNFNYLRHAHLFYLFIVVLAVAAGCRDRPQPIAKTEAEKALSTFEIAPGFKIELLAAEPLLGDPVDMEIDEYGRLYVVEMFGYPLDKRGTGQVKLLTDSDGDGKMDKSTVFADGFVLPNSVMRWKNGVLVTDAPYVLYLEDSDGDGKAEIRDTLLTGFALSNPQHNLNSPVLGVDNWIYLAHEGAVSTDTYAKEFGDPGDDIYFPGHPKSPRLGRNADGRSVRFRPDQLELEETATSTQFGQSFDAWGHHFLVRNSEHILQEVLAATYLSRNPNLLISDASEIVSDHGNAAEVFPITQNPEHQLLTDVGAITSACGITSYLGGAFPPPYDGNITFVAEPVSNLVHVDQLKDDGATFIASRFEPHKEFLASTDFRFRPVNMYVGPDGALYVVDFYRQIIEHPEWMGEEVVKSGELYNDSDKGRIYRITATGAKPADWTKGLKLGNDTNEQLVEKLASPNAWWRQNAQRLLVDRASKQAVPALNKMAINTSAPLGRLHALWTLEGIGELKPELIQQALKDSVAGIRENAIKLAELHLTASPDLVKALLPLQTDINAKVRFQLLCTLGSIKTPQAAEARHKLLFKDISDKWVQFAALSASSSQTAPLLKDVIDHFQKDVPAYASLIERLTTMVGASGEPGPIHQLIQKASQAGPEDQRYWQAPILEGLAEGMKTKKQSTSVFGMEENKLIQVFFDHPSSQVRKAALGLLKVIGIRNEHQAKLAIERAVKIAGDSKQADDKRAESIDFIALRNATPHAALLKKLIDPHEELSIQLAALRTLSSIPDTTVCAYVLQQWTVLTPEIRDAAIGTFLVDHNPARNVLLLDALESGKIQATSLSWGQKVGLMNQRDVKLRDRSRAILTKNIDKEVNKAYQRAMDLKGDVINGKAIYEQSCALCHQLRGKMGVTLGPDLATIHNWSPDAIMSNILAPNLSISSGFDLWEVELKNGETAQGIIAAETPAAITIRNVGSVEKTINRNGIKSLKALNMSIMPTGLEKQIDLQQMADLLAFLKQNK